MILFLQKLLIRFTSKSPLAFRILNIICNVCLVVGLIQEIIITFFITIPPPYDLLANRFFLGATFIVRILSGLTVDKKTIKPFYEKSE